MRIVRQVEQHLPRARCVWLLAQWGHGRVGTVCCFAEALSLPLGHPNMGPSQALKGQAHTGEHTQCSNLHPCLHTWHHQKFVYVLSLVAGRSKEAEKK